MATILDITALEHFSLLFSFLFVLVVVFAILAYSKFLGENKTIHGLIALFMAILTLFSDAAVKTINLMAPWFVVLFVFILFMLMALKIFGTTDSQIMGVLANPEYRYIVMWIVALGIIITIGSLTSSVWGGGAPVYNESGSGSSSDVGTTGSSAFWGTLVHPRVLGLTLIFLVALFTIHQLTKSKL